MTDHDHDQDDERVRELAKSLAYDRPQAERRETVRAELLARAKSDVAPARDRWMFVGGGFAAGIAAAAAIVLLLGHHGAGSSAPLEPLTIESSEQAELEHTVATDAAGKQDEVVRVHAGKVRFAVGATTATHHVMVKTGDAQIEGVGAYEVSVTHDALAAVTVTAGVASVSVKGQRAVFLAAGQTWTAPVLTADIVPSAPVPVPVPAPALAPVPTPAPAPALPVTAPVTVTTPESPMPTPTLTPTPESSAPEPPPEPTPEPTKSATEEHFQHGWDLLRAQRYAEAAIELGLAADASGPLAADARYFQAAALVKAGRKTEAEHAYVQFLDAAPKSLRRGRAAIALARLIAERGDVKSARAWYQAAVDDRDPDVAAAARAALR